MDRQQSKVDQGLSRASQVATLLVSVPAIVAILNGCQSGLWRTSAFMSVVLALVGVMLLLRARVIGQALLWLSLGLGILVLTVCLTGPGGSAAESTGNRLSETPGTDASGEVGGPGVEIGEALMLGCDTTASGESDSQSMFFVFEDSFPGGHGVVIRSGDSTTRIQQARWPHASGEFLVYVDTSDDRSLVVRNLRKNLAVGFLSVSASVREPSISADGRFVVFLEDEGGDNRIVVWDTATGETSVVVDAAESVANPQVSPDGQNAVYLLLAPSKSEVLISPLSGGPAVMVTEGEYADPTWSPNGNALLASKGTGTQRAIALLPLHGDEKLVTDASFGVDSEPALFPNCEGFAFVRVVDDSADLWVWDAAIGESSVWLASAGVQSSPSVVGLQGSG